MAEYHAAARAVGGCAIYVRYHHHMQNLVYRMYVHSVWNLTSSGSVVALSDKPEQHDFNLLKKLVLPDGSILRAKLPGRPTRDYLFSDPAKDGKRLVCKNLSPSLQFLFFSSDNYNLPHFVENLEYKRLH